MAVDCARARLDVCVIRRRVGGKRVDGSTTASSESCELLPHLGRRPLHWAWIIESTKELYVIWAALSPAALLNERALRLRGIGPGAGVGAPGGS